MAKSKTKGDDLPTPKFTITPDGGVRLGELKLRASTWAERSIEQDFCRTPMYQPGGRCDIGAVTAHIMSTTVQVILVRHLGDFESERDAAEAIEETVRRFGSLQLGMAIGEALRQANPDVGKKDKPRDTNEEADASGEA